jgi:hypothetical protein
MFVFLTFKYLNNVELKAKMVASTSIDHLAGVAGGSRQSAANGSNAAGSPDGGANNASPIS